MSAVGGGAPDETPQHARFAPSASERWVTCPGSVALTRDMPDESSVYADEGTAAHSLGERALRYGKPVAHWMGERLVVRVGSEFVVDDNMATHVQSYVDDVLSRVGPGDTLLTEQRLSFSQSIGVPDQFGTADALIIRADGRHFTLCDLKYGMGERVDAEENTQLMTYAVAALETLGMLLEDVESVTLVINQPRLDHLSEWVCTRKRLEQYTEQMRLAAKHALRGLAALDATGEIPPELFSVSEKGCRWCKAKATCQTLQRVISAEVFDDFEALDDPEALTVLGNPPMPKPQKIGYTFALLDMIEDWCRAVRGEVERMVLAGMTVVGPDGLPMKVIEGRKGARRWANPEVAEGVLLGVLGPEVAYEPPKLLTPAKVEKVLGKKRKAEWDSALAPLVVQERGSPKVALGSVDAPPYDGSAGAGEFSNLE